MLQLHNLALLFAAISKGVAAAVVSVDFPIANEEIAPDGFLRNTTLASGIFPGPLIRASRGDQLQINVHDQLKNTDLDQVTSIHWHGLFQLRTNWADGVDAVTQCPIIPDESFLYNFTVTEQSGTFWYHSHFKAQYCDGLRGALIIDDPNDPHKSLYDVDDATTIITLADWYHITSIEAGLARTPEYNSTLINGLGRYSGGSSTPLAVVNVISGKRYRLRLISISCNPSFILSIDSHTLTVIEVDGENVQPLVVDSLEIFAGQRYSVVLTANKPINNYWVRALPQSARLPDADYSGFANVAILRYLEALPINPSTNPNTNVPVSKLPLVETDLHPLEPTTLPGNPTTGGADININLDVQLAGPVFTINGVKYDAPTVPVLLQILTGASVKDLVPAGSIYSLELNKSVEITIPGGVVGGNHPLHLHGHSFYVVRSAGNESYNFDNPVMRDVVNIGIEGDNVTIRFFTDNYGPWFLHCHIDWHLITGFAVVFAEDVADTPSEVVPSPDWSLLCPAYYAFQVRATHRLSDGYGITANGQMTVDDCPPSVRSCWQSANGDGRM